MTILEVITGLPPAAGTTTFLVEVLNRLAARGHAVFVAVEPVPHSGDFARFGRGVQLLTIEPILRGEAAHVARARDALAVARSQPLDFSSAGVRFDVVHLHGVWAPVLHRVAVWARRRHLPIVWSPHGMLTPWALGQGRFKKRLLWWLYQKRDLACADLIHVTAPCEEADIRRLGLRTGSIEIPLGVTLPSHETILAQEASANPRASQVGPARRADRSVSALPGFASASREKARPRIALFVSRVQKKKGLPNLIRAWAQAKNTANWICRIVGPDEENHTAELKDLAQELGVASAFEFVGPKFGDELAREYAAASFFILPTLSENFASVVLEALSYGLPVLTTKGAPWQELAGAERRGWWIDIGVEPLRAALDEILSLPDARLAEIGANGRQLVASRYGWESVVAQVEDAYKKVVASH